MISCAILALICGLLLLGLTRQFVTVGARGAALDELTILPQWKFFAQSRLDSDSSSFDTPHILARVLQEDGSVCNWQEIDWTHERTMLYAFWNPPSRGEGIIGEAAVTLVENEHDGTQGVAPSGLAYLTVLSHCLNHQPLKPGEALQFAVATTRGFENRSVSLGFLSAWHCP